jgi:hypothetical protein
MDWRNKKELPYFEGLKGPGSREYCLMTVTFFNLHFVWSAWSFIVSILLCSHYFSFELLRKQRIIFLILLKGRWTLKLKFYSIGHKKSAMAKKFFPVFQRFLAVVYSVAFNVWAVESPSQKSCHTRKR